VFSNLPIVRISPYIRNAGLFAEFVVAVSADNIKQSNQFKLLKEEQYQRLGEVYSNEYIEHNKILRGFRDAKKKLGISSKKYPSSPEKLLRLFIRDKNLPSINLLVDIGNYVSLETLLSIGVHRLDSLGKQVSLQLTNGSELFIPLGSSKSAKIGGGEFAYTSDNKEIICRMDCMQCDSTKLSVTTSDCMYIIQGNANTSVEYVKQAVEKIIYLAQKYCNAQSRILKTEESG